MHKRMCGVDVQSVICNMPTIGNELTQTYPTALADGTGIFRHPTKEDSSSPAYTVLVMRKKSPNFDINPHSRSRSVLQSPYD